MVLDMFDEATKTWSRIEQPGDYPPHRSGHVMVCYYNYIFVFGGLDAFDKYLGDLWVFDIVLRDWHMLSDAARTHELVHKEFEGGIPEQRAFATGTVFPDFGAMVMAGGLLADGSVSTDLWQLDLDQALNYIENPTKFSEQNLWKYLAGQKHDDLVARWAHTAGLVNSRTMLVFGGIDSQNYAMRSVFAYDFLKNEILPLQESGAPPPTRLGHGLLPVGAGLFLLYGGADPKGRGSFSDLWHVRVHLDSNDIHFSQMKYKGDHEHYILSWRTGFKMAFIYGM